MAVWADIDDDGEASSPVLTAQSRNHDNSAGQSHDYGRPSSYIAHALRCYPYAQRRCLTHDEVLTYDAEWQKSLPVTST